MSRSGYIDDFTDESERMQLLAWRGAVSAAIRGRRGQAFLRGLADALDAMPDKRLACGTFVDDDGCQCALAVAGAARGVSMPEWEGLDQDDQEGLAVRLGIARALVCEVMYANDEMFDDYLLSARPGKKDQDLRERRWAAMREWVGRNLAEGVAA